MDPLNVDALFARSPDLFAYQLPTHVERSEMKPGDLVKLFFQIERFKNPKPIWFTVTDAGGGANATAVLANINQSDWATSTFPGTVNFGVEHIYRLPLDRPEVENAKFDDSCRC